PRYALDTRLRIEVPDTSLRAIELSAVEVSDASSAECPAECLKTVPDTSLRPRHGTSEPRCRDRDARLRCQTPRYVRASRLESRLRDALHARDGRVEVSDTS